MQQTLPKSIILRGYQSFTNVIANGTSLHGSMLTAYYLVADGDGHTRIGFSVPKKQVPGAAQRIRIKRLMREAVRKHIWHLIAFAKEKAIGTTVVLMFKKGKTREIARITLNDVESDWIDLQQRITKAL